MKMNVTYFDNFNIDTDNYEDVYRETYDLDKEADVDERALWDYISDCLEMEWDDFKDNLRYSKNNDHYCVITGTTGLWNGHPTIEPTVCDSLLEAIQTCVSRMDYCIIEQVNGHLEVTGIHHDGRNCFEIHLLNDKGERAAQNLREGWGMADFEKRTYHKAMEGYLY